MMSTRIPGSGGMFISVIPLREVSIFVDCEAHEVEKEKRDSRHYESERESNEEKGHGFLLSVSHRALHATAPAIAPHGVDTVETVVALAPLLLISLETVSATTLFHRVRFLCE